MNIAIIACYAPSIINFRGKLIEKLLNFGMTVTVIIPDNSDLVEVNKIELMGVSCEFVSMQSTGLNPLGDLKTFFAIRKVLKKIKPTHVLAYTIKPVIYGMLASRTLGIRNRYSLITGLGSMFISETTKGRFLLKLIKLQYRIALKGAPAVIFQNPDDRDIFQTFGISTRGNSFVVNGSGVDLDYFSDNNLIENSPVTFLLVARLLRDKGIFEYVDAANFIKKKYPNVIFRIAGYLDKNPSAIKSEEITSWCNSGVINFLGKLEDVRSAITCCSVYVLPSYREGTSRGVLEAMSMSRPIITTNAPGCRETVIEGENGYLVPVKSATALADAMEKFIANPSLIEKMGKKSREIAEEKYDVHKVNNEMFRIMKLA